MIKYIVTLGGKPQGENRHSVVGIQRDYTNEASHLFNTAKKYNYVCKLWENKDILNHPYAKLYPAIFSKPSFGWAFQALILDDILQHTQDNSFILWVDSNHEIVSDPESLIELAKSNNGVYCHDHFNVQYDNITWTKRSTFIEMDCDHEDYHYARHVQVNSMGFINTEFTHNFISEWLRYCLNYNCIIGNDFVENYPIFREHRHQQSIFSILIKKYRLNFFPYPQNIIRERDTACIQ